MSYVKLTARPDTWFKAGTEVYDEDTNVRMTLERWEQWRKEWGNVAEWVMCVRGIRVTEDPGSEGGHAVGEEREDGECCGSEEFDVEIVEEAR